METTTCILSVELSTPLSFHLVSQVLFSNPSASWGPVAPVGILGYVRPCHGAFCLNAPCAFKHISLGIMTLHTARVEQGHVASIYTLLVILNPSSTLYARGWFLILACMSVFCPQAIIRAQAPIVLVLHTNLTSASPSKVPQQHMAIACLRVLNFLPCLFPLRCWIWDPRCLCGGLRIRLQWILSRPECKCYI